MKILIRDLCPMPCTMKQFLTEINQPELFMVHLSCASEDKAERVFHLGENPDNFHEHQTLALQEYYSINEVFPV